MSSTCPQRAAFFSQGKPINFTQFVPPRPDTALVRGKSGTHLRVGPHGCPGAGGTNPARPKRLLLAQCPLGGMDNHGSQHPAMHTAGVMYTVLILALQQTTFRLRASRHTRTM